MISFELIITIISSLFGLFIGSFLGIVIDRFPEGRSILWGRSQCDYCKKKLRWFELIPLASFILQRGKCRRCNKALSFKYPFIEICSAILFMSIWFFVDFSVFLYIPAVIIASSLLAIAFIDARYMVIPDFLLIVVGVGTIAYHFFRLQSLNLMLSNYFFSGVISFLLFYFLWEITSRKGIGFGDVKLAFFLGLLTGVPRVILGIYTAFLTGALFGLILLLKGKKTMKSPIPFGPFLILGAIISLFIDVSKIFSFLL